MTNTVAVNGDETIAELATVHYTGSRLLEAYLMARDLIKPR
ncbi:hypothetical protein [Nocardiopsis xinjiangensis]|nr:hypothetical protein [Nocardiopsis xinjiangensis]